MTGRILGVSGVSVLRWVRAEALPEPEVSADVNIFAVGEMWNVVKNGSVADVERPGLQARRGVDRRRDGAVLCPAYERFWSAGHDEIRNVD